MEYDIGEDESVSGAVVRAVSAIEGRDPRTLRPLSDVVDPDALNALFDCQYDGRARIGGQLAFVYSRCAITIDNGEYLTIGLLDPLEYDRPHPRSSQDRPR